MFGISKVAQSFRQNLRNEFGEFIRVHKDGSEPTTLAPYRSDFSAGDGKDVQAGSVMSVLTLIENSKVRRTITADFAKQPE